MSAEAPTRVYLYVAVYACGFLGRALQASREYVNDLFCTVFFVSFLGVTLFKYAGAYQIHDGFLCRGIPVFRYFAAMSMVITGLKKRRMAKTTVF